MKTVTIFRNAVDPEDRKTQSVDDVCAFLKDELGTWPDTARLYHECVAATHDVTPSSEADLERLQQLDGNFYAVVWPEDPITIAVVIAIVVAAVAIGVAFLLRPTVPNSNDQSPNNSLTNRQNKARPNSRIPDICGTVRSTPDLLALPYKIWIANQQVEVCFMCIGRNSFTVLDCQDDQTPVNEIAGEYVAVYPPYNSPNSAAPAPQTTFGIEPSSGVPVVYSVQQSNAVNGQVCRPTNAGNLETHDNVAFQYGGNILTNDSSLDFTDYFVASTQQTPSFLTIYTNDDGINASDPAENVHSVGLAGTYQILSVTANQITLSNPSTVNANWDVLAQFAGQTSTYHHTFQITSATSTVLGPYVLNVADMTEVWANFVGQNGLYYIDSDGNQKRLTVTIQMTAQSVNSALQPVGDSVTGTINVTGSALDNVTCGSTLKLVLPSPGPCQVTVQRITPMVTYHSNEAYVGTVQWSELFAVSDVTFVRTPPIAVPSGQKVAWAFATAVTPVFQNPDAEDATNLTNTSGTLYHDHGVTGELSGVTVTWSGFTCDSLPADAQIQSFVRVMDVQSLGTGNIVSSNTNLNHHATTTDFQGEFYSEATPPDTTLANITVDAGLARSLGGVARQWLFVNYVAVAVLFTTETEYTEDTSLRSTFGDFGNVTTVLSITAQTPDALSIKERKLNLLVTRNVPTWINRAATGPAQLSATSAPSNNAADILCAMALDPYIGRRQLSELDIPGIYGVADSAYLGGEHVDGDIAQYFGTFLMTEFCGTFDDATQTFEEMVAILAQAINCIAYRSAKTIGLSFEKQTSNSTILYNHRNKIPDSETRTVSFGTLNDNDSVYYDYVDPNASNFPNMEMNQTLYFPPSQVGSTPKRVKSKGVRNIVQATINGWRLFQKIVYSAIQTEFEATQEANLNILNDRILVADNTRTGTQDGEIIAVDGLTVTTSQPLTFADGEIYTAYLQLADETVQAIGVTPGPEPNQMVLAAAPNLALVSDPGQFARTTYVVVSNSTTARPLPFILTQKEPTDKNTYKLTAINYSDNYYAHDQDFKNNVILAPSLGYGPQGYTGEGLTQYDGTQAAPSGSGYGTSDAGSGTSSDPPVTTPPPSTPSTDPTKIILVNGA